MSTKIRWSMLILLTVLNTGLAEGYIYQAQEEKTGTGDPTLSGPEIHLQKLTEKLNLTEDQKAKLGALLQDQARQMETVRNDASVSQDKQRTKITAIRESFRTQIEAFLTPQQQTKLSEKKPKTIQKRMGTRGEPDHE